MSVGSIRLKPAIFSVAAFIAQSSNAFGDDPAVPPSASSSSKSPDLSKARLDLSVPDIPAFTALGVSPSKISRPTNLKDLALALSSGLNASGAIQNGLAVEVAPLKFRPSSSSNGTRELGTIDRVFGGLALSFGSNVAGTSPNITSSLAYGLRWVFGGYEPATDVRGLGACLKAMLPNTAPQVDDAFEAAPPPPTTPPTSSSSSHTPPKVQTTVPTLVTVQSLADCRTLFRAAHLGSTAGEVAYTHIDEASGSTSLWDINPNADIWWGAFSLVAFQSFSASDVTESALAKRYDATVVRTEQEAAAMRSCQVGACDQLNVDQRRALWKAALQDRLGHDAYAFVPLFFGRVDHKRIVPTATPRQTQLQLSARLPFITDGWSFFFEGGYKFTDLGGAVTPEPKNSLPLGLGGDVRVGDGTWLGLYAGYDALNGSLLSVGNLKWSIGEKRPYSY
jgi:hypothetical protein